MNIAKYVGVIGLCAAFVLAGCAPLPSTNPNQKSYEADFEAMRTAAEKALKSSGFLLEEIGPVQGEEAYRLVGILDRTGGAVVQQNQEAVRLRLYVTLRSEEEGQTLVSVNETTRRTNYGSTSGDRYSDKFFKNLNQIVAK